MTNERDACTQINAVPDLRDEATPRAVKKPVVVITILLTYVFACATLAGCMQSGETNRSQSAAQSDGIIIEGSPSQVVEQCVKLELETGQDAVVYVSGYVFDADFNQLDSKKVYEVYLSDTEEHNEDEPFVLIVGSFDPEVIGTRITVKGTFSFYSESLNAVFMTKGWLVK